MSIAFDTSVDLGSTTATSLSGSITVGSGANPLVEVNVVGDTASDKITGATCGGTAMVLVTKVSSAAGGSARWIYQFLLTGVVAGANAIVVSASGSIFIAAHAVSYTGAAQIGQPNASNTGVAASASSLTVAVTSTVDNCWLIGGIKNDFGAGSAGTGTTVRQASVTGGMTSCDGGASVTPAGSSSLQVTQGTTAWSGIVSAIAPASVSGSMFLVM